MTTEVILVTGATGYVGGRLIPKLLDAGYTVRAAGRSLSKLQSRSWGSHPNIQIVEMDVFDPNSLDVALKGCSTAYYLIHSMNPDHPDFSTADKIAARHFLHSAEKAHLKRIVYLSGLGEESTGLSEHLQSRTEVGHILQSGHIPVTILRAAMIIGSGSASFEILRYLVDRLPALITPKWVHTPTQPIAIRNVLTYLVGCLEELETIGQTFDIGGPEVVSYRELMDIYSEEAGLPKRAILPVPVFTPGISSYWIQFITPVHATIARPLAEGLKNPTVCLDNKIQTLISQELFSCREASHKALQRVHHHDVETHWSDAGVIPIPEDVYPGDPSWSGGTVYSDRRSITMKGSLEEVWQPIVQIGGTTGWYYGNILWQIRGLMDMFFGGVGLRRGRRHPSELMPGDALDFWRVMDVHKPKYLRLFAEMKVPGEAFLEFILIQHTENRIELQQVATFVPRGLLGILYWHMVTPLHNLVFNGMLKGIAKASGKPVYSGPTTLSDQEPTAITLPQ